MLLSLGLGGAARGAEEADLILQHGKIVTVDRDLLTCPEGEIREAHALTTYLNGTKIFERQD